MNTLEKFTTLILVGTGLFVGVALILGLSITIIAGLAMLVCNWALPMFDIQYPITFWQGCGIGVMVSFIRMCFANNVQVNK